MDTIQNIVTMLTTERDRLNRAIEALSGNVKRRGRPPKNPYNDPKMPDWVKPKALQKPPAVATTPAVAHKRTMSAEGRKRIQEAARKRWKLIKAGKLESPFAKKKAGKK